MPDPCPTCGVVRLDVVYIGHAEAEIRSLRAKLMRERADRLEQSSACCWSYRDRARRLRAKAERIERGGK